MKSHLNLGLIVADDMEYLPLQELCEKINGKEQRFYTRPGHNFLLEKDGKTIEIHSVLCGIGKVNAAAAAMHLVDKKVDLIINFGLSGGISGVKRGDIVVGTSFLEHDFDLTSIGYAPAQKPGQDYVYYSNKALVDLFLNAVPGAKSGTMVTGDRFVCDENLREFLKEKWNAVACDMETAAIAYVADLGAVPFVSIRQISDDAGNDAYQDYCEMNNSQNSLFDSVLAGIDKLYSLSILWK